ncbi:MAG: FAD-binding protein, partial [bacterium]|nr:FAD-binding protein [bacterium]
TVAVFTRHAAAAPYPAFGRGASAYDKFNGDRTLPGAAATLGPLDEPPFYAVAIRIGALGTSGGPRTDERGRVLDRSGTGIPGLWAAGNVMAAPTATVYGGAGGTLGPAMTFGYLAGRDAAN